MKICIYGAGATGCVLVQKFLGIGQDVSLVARGAHLEAMQKNGLRVITPVREYHLPVAATDNPENLPAQDIIIIASKAYSLSEIAPHVPTLLHASSILIPVCNGIPWWFLLGLKGRLENRRIRCLDAQGIIGEHIPFEQVIGGVIYMAAALREPGVVTSNAPPRFMIGEPTGDVTERVSRFDRICCEAGFKDAMTTNIRGEIWHKLSWNIVFNPLSVITGMNSGQLARDTGARRTAFAMVTEMQHVGDALGLDVTLDPERQIYLAEKAGHHKPSMLQDYEAGKRIEIDAIVGAMVEIAEMLSIAVPHIEEIYRALAAKACKGRDGSL